MEDRLDSYADPRHFSSSRNGVVTLARKVGRAVGYIWFTGAAMTWMLCPSPSPLHDSPTAKYADEAGYFIECLSLWPAIDYFTLENPSA